MQQPNYEYDPECMEKQQDRLKAFFPGLEVKTEAPKVEMPISEIDSVAEKVKAIHAQMEKERKDRVAALEKLAQRQGWGKQ